MGEPENKRHSDVLYDFKKESIILLCYGDVCRVLFDVLVALGNPGRAPVVISIMQRAMALYIYIRYNNKKNLVKIHIYMHFFYEMKSYASYDIYLYITVSLIGNEVICCLEQPPEAQQLP